MPARAKLYKAKLGHVRLDVRDLERTLAFYTRFVQLDLVERVDDTYAFLSGGRPHHVLALHEGAQRMRVTSPHSTGVDHIAFEVPDKRSFARAFKALTAAGIRVRTGDNAISWSMYFRDPDGNGVELYCDTRSEPDGRKLWQGIRRPLERARILAALRKNAPTVRRIRPT